MTICIRRLFRFAVAALLVFLCYSFIVRYGDAAPTGNVKIDAVLAVLQEKIKTFLEKERTTPRIEEPQQPDLEFLLIILQQELAQLDREYKEMQASITRNGTLTKETAQRMPNYLKKVLALVSLHERREAVRKDVERAKELLNLQKLHTLDEASRNRTQQVRESSNLAGIISGDGWASASVRERPELTVVSDEFMDNTIWKNAEPLHVSPPPKTAEPTVQSDTALASIVPLPPRAAPVIPASPVAPRQIAQPVQRQSAPQLIVPPPPVVVVFPRVVQRPVVRQVIVMPRAVHRRW